MSDLKLRPKISGSSLFVMLPLVIMLPLALLLTACAEKYSPDTYSSSAVQQASKVESGVVVGVRKVSISADPTIASATGAAAGGIAGSQVAEGAYSALSALGGAVVGGVAGSEAGHKIQDTFGYEYIVRNGKGDLLSVTQNDKTPLKIGQRVLLIQGSQARIVNDYTEPVEDDLAAKNSKEKSSAEGKADMSKAAKEDGKPPAPAEQTETEKMINAATAAAIAAITAKGMEKPNDETQATSAAQAAGGEAAGGATTKAKDEPAPAVAKTPAATDAAPATTTPASDEKKEAAPAKPAVQPGAPTKISPITGAPGPNEQPTPAPATTKIVPLPTETVIDAVAPDANATKATPEASEKTDTKGPDAKVPDAKAPDAKDKNADTANKGEAEDGAPDADKANKAEPETAPATTDGSAAH